MEKKFNPGERVEISSSLPLVTTVIREMAGLQGVVEEDQGGTTVKVRLHDIDRPLSIPRGSLEKLPNYWYACFSPESKMVWAQWSEKPLPILYDTLVDLPYSIPGGPFNTEEEAVEHADHWRSAWVDGYHAGRSETVREFEKKRDAEQA